MNWHAFFNMGGYAFYVWGSYGLAAFAISVEIISLILRKHTLLRRLNTASALANAKQNETTS